MFYKVTKRLFDFLVAGTGIIVLSPFLLLLTLMVRIYLGSPVLFRQYRPGLHGKPFRLLKFRTMTDTRNTEGHLLPDAERLTAFGRFLRHTSLDELPGLFNVLKGDLSLVGPRPLLMQYLDRYTPKQMRRHNVSPGITGWAQVQGRNAISWDQKFTLDIWYVDNHSWWLDIKILTLTVMKMFRQEGISHSGHVSMPEFFGENNQAVLKTNYKLQEQVLEESNQRSH